MKLPFITLMLAFCLILQTISNMSARDVIRRQSVAMNELKAADSRLKTAADELASQCERLAIAAGITSE